MWAWRTSLHCLRPLMVSIVSGRMFFGWQINIERSRHGVCDGYIPWPIQG